MRNMCAHMFGSSFSPEGTNDLHGTKHVGQKLVYQVQIGSAENATGNAIVQLTRHNQYTAVLVAMHCNRIPCIVQQCGTTKPMLAGARCDQIAKTMANTLLFWMWGRQHRDSIC